MIAETRPLTEITQEALHLLYQKLGIVNTVRFINQFSTGFGNYTEERRILLEDQTLDEVLADLHSYQAQRTPKQQDLPLEIADAESK